MTGSAAFVPLLPEGELAVGQIRAFTVNGWPVIVTRSATGLRALLNRCSHAATALEGGRVRRDFIICPLHGAQFDLATGACLSPTRYPTIRTFPLAVAGGMIAVQVPDTQPTAEELPIPTIG
ncbi:Rieske (2Fe-2S) protein [Sphingobium lactosutens]|uniref:Rieske (2Fe-2S) protein n=1 Tax=Sphingobium lactosutens TaxID=522773 RepID=UPI0015C1BFCC